MNLPYIINAALVLCACLVFYKLLLHRETFYKVNRWLLIICVAVAFLLPLVPVPGQFSLKKKESPSRDFITSRSVTVVEERDGENDSLISESVIRHPEKGITSELANGSAFAAGTLMNWLFWIYWFGVAVFAASFIFQLAILAWRTWRNPAIMDGRFRIVEVSGHKAPCSFGNTIFINPSLYDWDTYNQILQHEKIHIRQQHTLDIVIAELMLVFQWFNPFAWLYRREMESNLEYLTDDQLVHRQEVDKESYQLSLVKVSAPHFPLSLTTNYNQSILKKRIAMMNSKRSNLHTAWKYFFLLPLLAFLACLLNEPVAMAQTNNANQNVNSTMETAGYWFAVIKGDRVNIRFSDKQMDDKDFESNSFHGSTFDLADLGNIPKGSSGTFTISREAGKMEMTGKFDGNTGMGTYKFEADKAYVRMMNAELKENLDDDDQMAFFFINIRKEYLQMLKKEGFTNITKDDLIPMAAMNIDAAYIKSIKDAGFQDVSLEKLVPLKALNVDAAYIKEIRDAGYKNITTDQLVSFKAQGIDKDYIGRVRKVDSKEGNDDPDDIVSFKAMNIDDAFIESFKSAGVGNIPREVLVAYKAIGVTPEYIKSWRDMGFKDIKPEDFVGMKSQSVTPEFLKSFVDMGYTKIKPEELVAFKALSITPDFIKTYEALGYKNIDAENLPALKSLNVTPDFIKSFEAVGFKNIELDEFVSVKAVGVTPEYIKDMRAKGFDYDKLQKYVTLKTLN